MFISLPEHVKYIISSLEASGYEAYAVGGCVRDSLLNREPDDWDITTSALPQQVKAVFPRTIDTGIQHGTVTVMLNHTGYEVTTYRIDGKYTDSRHPDTVSFTRSLEEDLKRRDFTINAMAYSDSTGLVDLFDGAGDLARRTITCVGCARERFKEDALRILRAVRFSAQLGFDIDRDTLEAARLLAPSLTGISVERIHAELDKILLSDNPDRLELLCRLSLADYIFPELCVIRDFHTVSNRITAAPRDKFLRWALLFFSIFEAQMCSQAPAEDARKIMRRFKFDNNTIHTVSELIRLGMVTLENLSDEEVRRFIHDAGRDSVFMHLQFHRITDCRFDYDGLSARIAASFERGECTCISELKLNGHDLIGLGIKNGKEIGLALDYLLDKVLADPALNTRDALSALILNNSEFPEAAN